MGKWSVLEGALANLWPMYVGLIAALVWIARHGEKPHRDWAVIALVLLLFAMHATVIWLVRTQLSGAIAA